MGPKSKSKKSNRVCCVAYCRSIDDGSCSFHQFPRPGAKVAIPHPSGEVFYCDRRKIWEDRVGDEVQIVKLSKVCSVHFEQEDFTRNSRSKISNRRLKSTAVPSLYLPDEYSAFSHFNEPRPLAQDFLKNFNNNNIVRKSARVREKKTPTSDKEEILQVNDRSSESHPVLEDALSEDDRSYEQQIDVDVETVSEEDAASLQRTKSDLKTVTNGDYSFPQRIRIDLEDLASEDSTSSQQTGIDLENVVSEDSSDSTFLPEETEVEEIEVMVKDDEENKIDIQLEELKNEVEADETVDKKDSKEHVNAFLDMALMHTSFELEKLTTSGTFVPYLPRCNN